MAPSAITPISATLQAMTMRAFRQLIGEVAGVTGECQERRRENEHRQALAIGWPFAAPAAAIDSSSTSCLNRLSLNAPRNCVAVMPQKLVSW